MALTDHQVGHIAHLARLDLQAADVTAFTAKLNTVLGLIDQLQAVDTQGVAPMAHPLDATQVLRPDEVTETNQRDAYQAIAPAVEAGCYLVPRVVE